MAGTLPDMGTPKDGCLVPQTPVEETVKDYLDRRIQLARKNVEDLCILKAKAESLQILEYPVKFLQELSW